MKNKHLIILAVVIVTAIYWLPKIVNEIQVYWR